MRQLFIETWRVGFLFVGSLCWVLNIPFLCYQYQVVTLLYGSSDVKIVKLPPRLLQNIPGNFLVSINFLGLNCTLHTEDLGMVTKYVFTENLLKVETNPVLFAVLLSLEVNFSCLLTKLSQNKLHKHWFIRFFKSFQHKL